MTPAKKKTAAAKPKAKAKPVETTMAKPKRETTARPRANNKANIDAILDHMTAHGLSNPWSALNAGRICGICGRQL